MGSSGALTDFLVGTGWLARSVASAVQNSQDFKWLLTRAETSAESAAVLKESSRAEDGQADVFLKALSLEAFI